MISSKTNRAFWSHRTITSGFLNTLENTRFSCSRSWSKEVCPHLHSWGPLDLHVGYWPIVGYVEIKM